MELSPRERLIQIMKREQALFIRQTLSQKPDYEAARKPLNTSFGRRS